MRSSSQGQSGNSLSRSRAISVLSAYLREGLCRGGGDSAQTPPSTSSDQTKARVSLFPGRKSSEGHTTAGWDAFLVPYPTDVAAAPLRAGSPRQLLGDSCGPGVRGWFLKSLLRHHPSLSFLVCKMGPTISTVQCNKCELSNVQDFWSHPRPPPPNKSRCGRAQFTAA